MNKKINKLKKLKIAVSIIVVVLSLFSVLEVTNRINFVGGKPTDTTESSLSDSNTGPSNKIDYSPAKPEDTVISPEKSNSGPDATPNPTPSTPISVLITRANRTSVGVYIEKITDGTCTLSVTQNGSEKISISSKVISQKDYSTCEGFEIDSTKLNSSAFTVKVSVSSSGRTGSAAQEVN